MTHILDRPIWSALTTRHAGLAIGDELAKRYPDDVSPFAAACDTRPESLAALAALGKLNPTMILLQADPIDMPPGFQPHLTATLVQMVADEAYAEIGDPRVRPLTMDDAAQMLDLAILTKPGPFKLGAQRMGNFWGVKQDGRLIAMAGQRMKQPGYSELSGVCTHPDSQGQGLGRLLSLFVAGKIAAQGDVPYLHAYATNSAAIRLYESIGFRLRRTMHVAMGEVPR